jgi:hypothetical protein
MWRFCVCIVDADAARLAYGDATALVGVGKRRFELPRQQRHLAAGVLERGAVGQPADQVDDPAVAREAVAVAVADPKHRRGNPDADRIQAADDPVKVVGGDPDDREVGAVDADRRAEHGGARVEPAPPEFVAEHRNGTPAGHAILVVGEEAAEGGLDPQDVEVVRRHDAAHHAEPAVGEADVHRRGGVVRREALERPRVVPVVEIVGIGERERVERRPGRNRLIDEDQAGRLGQRQQFQEDGLGQTQDGAGHTEAQRQRHHGRKGEGGRSRDPPDRVAQILADGRQCGPPCGLPRVVLPSEARNVPNRAWRLESASCMGMWADAAGSARWRSDRSPEMDTGSPGTATTSRASRRARPS